MPSQNLLQSVGSHGEKDTGWAPIYTNRFFFGLQTNRNPLRSPAGAIYDSYYKIGGTDALIGGVNAELSNRLTLCRRPGNTAGLSPYISSTAVPGIPDTFYSFHEIGGTVRVFVDTPATVYLIGGYANGSGTGSQGVIPIFTKGAGAGQAYFTGVGNTLYIADGVEVVKWVDSGVGVTGNSLSQITKTSLTSNIATITAANSFAPGQQVVISGTANGSGVFNGTFTIITANAVQFTFALTNIDVAETSDTGFASAVYNAGIAAPTTAPELSLTPSGAAAVAWQASTVFETMGIAFDSATNSLQQLVSVNALNDNTTQFGTSGNGEPNWNQTPGGTTSDGTITWTNWGPVPAWSAHTLYTNASVGGTLANPSQIYDPVTKSLQINIAQSNSSATSGATKPNFVAVQGATLHDPPGGNTPPNVKWWTIFPAPSRWKPSTAYGAFLGHDLASTAVVEPTALPAGTNQIVYLQISNGGTSGSSGTTPPFSATAGVPASDNQLLWASLGIADWSASTVYTPWTGFPATFSAVLDNNTPRNVQVCTSGVGNFTSGATQPRASWLAGHAYVNGNTIADSNGNLQTVTTGGTSGNSKTLTTSDITNQVATYTTSASHGYAAGQYVTVTGSTNDDALNVVRGLIVAVPSATTFTVNILHDDIASAADTGNVKAGPTWNATLGGTTNDGTVVWTNGGTASPAAWGTKYGDTVTDGSGSNGVVWTCVGPPVVWAPTTIYHLPTTGWAPPSNAQAYGGSEVISGTSPNQQVQATTVSGKSGLSAPSFSSVLGNFTLDGTVTWTDAAAYSQYSLAFSRGYIYAYAYKSRAADDQYSPVSTGGLGLQPPGFFVGSPNGSFVNGLPAPTGSGDGSVSTASPVTATATGANTGTVITVSGVGSADPGVDTIVIFRTFDGGATLFELTEFPNPGGGNTWKFQDFLPDIASTVNGQLFPGLNTLVIAPTNHSNDPIPSGAINLVQYFGRTFFSVGATVYATRGPDIGGANQPPGNGFTAAFPGNFWSFSSPVTRMVPTVLGLLVFTTSDISLISGGPSVTQLFQNIFIPGIGLTSFNALGTQGSLIHFFTADSQVVVLDPNYGVSKTVSPIGNLVVKTGTQTTTYSPSTAYVTYHTQGLNDDALFVADGSTGWLRCVTNMAPDSAISGPVWSPKANIVGGVKAIQSLEVAPGVHALLMGSTSSNQPVLVRDSTYTTFADNGVAYPSNFIFGSIVLANPGQLAELGFITCEFMRTGTSPRLSVMLDEIADTVMVITAAAQSGSNTTYTYTLTSGPAPVPGSGVTITGMSNSGNNGTFEVVTAGVGTFTVVNANGVNASVQTGSATFFEDLSGYVFSATGLPPQDAPTIYGTQFSPAGTFANRYYFAQSINGVVPPQGTDARHMQVKIDFGSTDTVQNELLTLTIYGRHWDEL